MAGNNRDITLTVEVKEKGDGAKKAAKDLEGVDKAAVGAADSMKGANAEASKFERTIDSVGANVEDLDQSLTSATRTVRTHEEQVAHLRAEYARTQKQLKELDIQLADTNLTDKAGLKKARSEQRALLVDIRAAARAMDVDLIEKVKPALRAGAGGLGSIGGLPTPAVAGLVGAGSVAGIPLAAMIGGAISGAAGTAAMAAGILSAAKDSRVQAAAKSFGQSISAEFFHGGEAFVQPVIDGLAILKDAFHDIDLGESLEKVAPTVTVIAEGIADFARNFKPGFDKALERMGPFAEAAAEGIGDLGDALGDTVDMITDSEGAVDGIRLTFAALGGTLRFIGAELKFLEDRWHEIINVAGMFTSIGAHTGFATLDQGIRQLTGHSGELRGSITFMGSSAGEAAKKSFELANGLGAVDKNAIDATASLKNFYHAQLGVIDAKIAFEQSLDDMAEALKKNGNSLDITGQKGRDNMIAIQSAIKDAIRVRDELAAQGKIEEANAAYQRMIDKIRQVAKDAGISKQKIDELTKPVSFTITANLVTKGNFPKYVSSNFSQPAQDAMGVGRRASGGPVTKGMPYVVGDGGRPEWFVPNESGYVYPKVPSSGGGGAMNARPLVIQPTGNPFTDAAFQWLRTEIAARGGTLAVLGLRA